MLLTVVIVPVSAQPYRARVDSMINHLYLKKSWGPLLDETRSLLNRGIDFYNLRFKAGVAAYELKKYRQAVTHLDKAYTVLPGDTLVNSYYYWALKLSGQEDEASLLADQLSPDLLKAIKAKRKD
jgi:hypothetical protein